MLRASHALSATMLALLAAAAAPAHAVDAVFFAGTADQLTVSGVATDLANTTVGQDLWRFDFTVTGPMDAGEKLGISIGNDYQSMSNLTPSVSGFTTELDFANLARRYLITDTGATAASSSFAVGFVMSPSVILPRLNGLFNVQFEAPGSNTLFRSLTLNMVPAAPVPEPATYGLMALGLLAIGLRSRARKV